MLFVLAQEDAKQDAVDALFQDIVNKPMLLNLEYKSAPADCVSLKHPDSEDDVAASLVSEGFLTVESRREKRLAKMVAQLQKAQDEAKRLRVRLIRQARESLRNLN